MVAGEGPGYGRRMSALQWQLRVPALALLAGAALVALWACEPEKAKAPGNKNVIPAESDTMVRSQGPQVVDYAGKPLQLRCANIDGWLLPIPYLISDEGNALLISPSEFVARLDEVVGPDRAAKFWDDWRDTFIVERDFERMAQLGFNCARLPIYYRAIGRLEAGKPVLDETRLARIDQALDWGAKHGVYVVLDLHSAPGGQNGLATVADVPSTDLVARLWEGPDAKANQDATVAIWRSLAERYRDKVAVAGYDLLNEPALPSSAAADALPSLYSRIITAIREVDSKHMVILEGDELAHDFSEFESPMDDNMAYEFHAYALTGFEDWATPETQDLQPYLTLRTQHDRPIWLGEFGEGTKDWVSGVVKLMEDHQVGWAVYPWKRKQTFFWNPVLQMIPPTPKWYAVAAYLAQPADGKVAVPSSAEAEAGMAEILGAMKLANCTEDGGLANAIIKP